MFNILIEEILVNEEKNSLKLVLSNKIDINELEIFINTLKNHSEFFFNEKYGGNFRENPADEKNITYIELNDIDNLNKLLKFLKTNFSNTKFSYDI